MEKVLMIHVKKYQQSCVVEEMDDNRHLKGKSGCKLVEISVRCKEIVNKKIGIHQKWTFKNDKLAWWNFVFCPIKLLFDKVF